MPSSEVDPIELMFQQEMTKLIDTVLKKYLSVMFQVVENAAFMKASASSLLLFSSFSPLLLLSSSPLPDVSCRHADQGNQGVCAVLACRLWDDAQRCPVLLS